MRPDIWECPQCQYPNSINNQRCSDCGSLRPQSDAQGVPVVACPRCGSDKYVAQKQGFSAGNALAGDIIAGPVGLLAGFLGSGKINITCLACGHVWQPGR